MPYTLNEWAGRQGSQWAGCPCKPEQPGAYDPTRGGRWRAHGAGEGGRCGGQRWSGVGVREPPRPQRTLRQVQEEVPEW